MKFLVNIPNVFKPKDYIILDLDGCIADDRRRLPLIDETVLDPWAAYHADCENDPLINQHVVQLGRQFRPLIFTARPERVRPQTERWLRDVAGLRVERLFMRPNGCRKTSPELKGEYLKKLLATGIPLQRIVYAVDDRQDVLTKYWRSGITTILVEDNLK